MKTLFINVLCFSLICLSSLPSSAQDKQPVHRKTITVGGQGTRSEHGSFVDLKKGKVYGIDEASGIQNQIDMLYSYGKKTKGNIISLSSYTRNYFSPRYTKRMHEWTELNRGSFVALPADKELRKQFKKIKTAEQLKEAYVQAAKTVKDRPGYKSTLHGPSINRLRTVKVGDIIYFKSIYGRDEDMYAAFEILEVEEGYNGYIKIDLISESN
ncbi:hypothetical protein [Sinomicrobium sp.]